MMVGDFAAINDLLHMDGNIILYVKGSGRLCHQSRQGYRHIFGQKAAVGSGISNEFLFIQTLRVVQCLLRRISQQAVGISLQGGQVIQQWRIFDFPLAFHFLHSNACLLSAGRKQSIGIVFLCKTLAGCRTTPVQSQSNRIKFFGNEGRNRSFAHDRHCQRGRHDSANRQRLTVQA